MSKKKKRSVPVAPPKQEKRMFIDMNEMNLKKEHAVPAFRTGRHMTEKDRPRKKNWKREYERGKEPGRYRDDIGSGFFYSPSGMETINSIVQEETDQLLLNIIDQDHVRHADWFLRTRNRHRNYRY